VSLDLLSEWLSLLAGELKNIVLNKLKLWTAATPALITRRLQVIATLNMKIESCLSYRVNNTPSNNIPALQYSLQLTLSICFFMAPKQLTMSPNE
jgi:hypothetical protein